MKNLGYYNGKYDEIENMQIPMLDRVCWFGDGVYDATYAHNHVVFDMDAHQSKSNTSFLLQIHTSLLMLSLMRTRDSIIAIAKP